MNASLEDNNCSSIVYLKPSGDILWFFARIPILQGSEQPQGTLFNLNFFDSVSGMDTEDLASHVEEWSSQFQEEIGMDKGTVEAVNTFMVVVC